MATKLDAPEEPARKARSVKPPEEQAKRGRAVGLIVLILSLFIAYAFWIQGS